MSRPDELLDSALGQLRRRSFPAAERSHHVEQRIHDRLRLHPVRGPEGRGRLLAAAVILLALAGATAAGGMEKLRQWLVAVEVLHDDGSVSEGRVTEVHTGEDGATNMEIEAGEGARARIRVTPPELSPEGLKRVEVEILEGQPTVRGFAVGIGTPEEPVSPTPNEGDDR